MCVCVLLGAVRYCSFVFFFVRYCSLQDIRHGCDHQAAHTSPHTPHPTATGSRCYHMILYGCDVFVLPGATVRFCSLQDYRHGRDHQAAHTHHLTQTTLLPQADVM